MNRERALARLTGCYVTVPTLFHDDAELSLNLDGMRRHVRFLIAGGLRAGTGALLACGAAGDFPTLSFDERLRVTETVVSEANGQVAVVMGGQTTSTLELVRLVQAAGRLGAEYVQISPPFYFTPTADDLYEHFRAAAEAADAANVGLVVYNTYWTSVGISMQMLEKLASLPNVIGLKWSMPTLGMMEFERSVQQYAPRFVVIDNQMRFPTSHPLGARGIETHPCNYWPEWGVRLWGLLESRRYFEAQEELHKVVLPFFALWQEIEEQYTGGDGYLDKLCMELVGMDSSRCRPPTRDVRPVYRERARQMLIQCGVPRVKEKG